MNNVSKTIGWCDYSFNPIVGCKHGCFYCYARRIAKRFPKNFPNGFEPTFYPERLNELKKLKKPVKIFVCSVADLFAKWTPEEWRDEVLSEIQKPEYNHLTFQLLTKNPENIKLKAKENIWVGATITNQMEVPLVWKLIKNYEGLKFLSFEPILGFIGILDLFLKNIDWVIIGKLTGSKKIRLNNDWIASIIADCRRKKIPIFLKDNLQYPEIIKEYPRGK